MERELLQPKKSESLQKAKSGFPVFNWRGVGTAKCQCIIIDSSSRVDLKDEIGGQEPIQELHFLIFARDVEQDAGRDIELEVVLDRRDVSRSDGDADVAREALVVDHEQMDWRHQGWPQHR